MRVERAGKWRWRRNKGTSSSSGRQGYAKGFNLDIGESKCGLLLANVGSVCFVIGPRGFYQSILVLTWNIL